MTRYFFDTWDDDLFIEDDEGFEMPSLEAVRIEASRTLAELARDVIPRSIKRTLIVKARTADRSVLEARLVFEAFVLAGE